ncbi:MAG: 1-acyl-sn-glycerol-3-phosphate acyltransferase [Acidimicrobiia bacterium]|nr:1-acyl-sn-glycerol-3-phosphate acyltransferase [Acidimicrobiia bacterium]MCY4458681.1 lysophospholipid acyltransferase family protein [Acidimicrobiaceae bacterium]
MGKPKMHALEDGDTLARGRQSWFGRVLYRGLWLVVYVLIKCLFRLRVEGKENLPDGPFILSAAHRSFADTPIVAVITWKRLRFMGKESLWDSRLLGTFLTVMGGFAVRRGAADRTALRAASDVLALGEPLVMFPEGTRQVGDRLDRDLVLDGPAFVAARAGVPIVPVGLGGTPSALPIGSLIPRPAKVVAIIGEPIQPPPKVAGKVPRRAIRELTEVLYRDLSDLFVEARVAAGDEAPPTD